MDTVPAFLCSEADDAGLQREPERGPLFRFAGPFI